MNKQAEQKLTTRARVLVDAVRRMQDHDAIFGDPKLVAACAGELQRVFLNYAAKSQRKIGPAEHSAVNQTLGHIARIACGIKVHSDSYVEGGLFLAVAAEAAMEKTGNAEPVDSHERTEYELARELELDEEVEALNRIEAQTKALAEDSDS